MSTDQINIFIVTAENDALPDCKVGGIGDFVRDVSFALCEAGCAVTTIQPSYGLSPMQSGGQRIGGVTTQFRGAEHAVTLWQVPGRRAHPELRHIVLDHPAFSVNRGRIYSDDPPATPFATDASKFALFCAAVCDIVERDILGTPDVLHLQDWHAALCLVLCTFEPRYQSLREIRTVFTVHNLSLQGIRPLAGHDSSLSSWFPELDYDADVLRDPRWPDCVNPMAVGIRLADAVHVVSPSYAEEVQRPSRPDEGYFGGEGLESYLVEAHAAGRLHGILNGITYDEQWQAKPVWSRILALSGSAGDGWMANERFVFAAHLLLRERLDYWRKRSPATILTSVSRIADQKVRLFRQADAANRSALAGILEVLGNDGVYLFLGTGDEEYEQFLTRTMASHKNFLFLRGYSDLLANSMYRIGDLFLMPSSFEPCGISQMLAMRASQPCLVHHVGGLRDTVRDGIDGFAFTGNDPVEQATNFVAKAAHALRVKRNEPARWRKICDAAGAARFTWEESVNSYVDLLYSP